MLLYFVSHNPHKFEEVKEKAAGFGLTIEWANLEYEEIQADELETIAKKSCKSVTDIMPDLKDKSFFLEDAGLFVESLKGFPGPYSSYVFRTIGNDGILNLMKNKENRSAYFLSVIALYNRGNISIFRGLTHGVIINEQRGMNGFGFDPIFKPNNSDETFAQMSIKNKTLYGHRGKSLQELFTSLSKTAFVSK